MKYNPAFDVIRAFAVGVVFLFHTTYGRVPGGGLGVDVFFVLSGYLITSVLKREWETNSSISLSNFYYRRILRLVPALILGIALANLLWNNVRIDHNSNRLLANISAFFYFTNVVPSYITNTFGHMWSLAVEEQFYLIWPLILPLLKFRLKPIIAAFVITSLLAFVQMPIYASHFFVLDDGFILFKAPGLLLGGIIALNPTSIDGRLALFIGAITLSILAFYPGPTILINIAAGLLIIGGIKTKVAIWDNKYLIWIGKRSYGIYLFHFPISQYLEGWRELHSPLNFVLVMICKIVFTLLISYLSFETIEKYFLQKKDRLRKKHKQTKKIISHGIV